MSPRVTFLIPNHNGRELLDRLIPTLLAQSYADHRIVVLDDASTDGSLRHLAERWPEVGRIASNSNRGFAATVNGGIRASDSEYLAIVNTDVELDPGWLRWLVGALDADPGAGSATGKALIAGDHRLLDGAGDQLRWSGAATRRGHGARDAGQFDQPGEVISACAGFALYRRAAFDAVGLFDEDLIAYYEDLDWGLRAQLAGFSCRYEPRAVAYHVGGASHAGAARYLRLQRRNQLLVMLKCYPGRVLLRRAPEIMLGQLILLARGLRARTLGPQLLAYVDVVRALPGTLDKRRRLAEYRRDGFARVAARITPGPVGRRRRAAR